VFARPDLDVLIGMLKLLHLLILLTDIVALSSSITSYLLVFILKCRLVMDYIELFVLDTSIFLVCSHH